MPTTKDLIEIAALEDEFDLFDGELIKAGDDVLNNPSQSQLQAAAELKKRKRSQELSASSAFSFFPVEAQHQQATAPSCTTASGPSTSASSLTTDTSSFDKEVWGIVLEAKKAFHEQVSSEPFNPQDHELLPLNLSQSDDNPYLSPPSEPSLPENGGRLVATFNNGRPSVSVSISFSVTTFHNSRPSIKLSTNNQRKSVKKSSVSSSKAKLVSVITLEELKMEFPCLCSDKSCGLVACCQWELDGELSYECLDHQEKNFGGWRKGKELPIDSMSEEHHDAIVKLCSKNKNPDMPYLPPIPNLRQLLKKNIKLSQLEDEAGNKLDVTSSNIIGVMKGVALEDLTELQRSLIGYDQTNKPPEDFDRQICSPVVRRHHDNQRRCEAKLKNRKMKNLIKPDEDVPLCLGSIPYDRNPNSTTKMVVLLNHYQTWQESRSLGPLHTARALLSDGSCRSDTPGLIRGSLGPRNYDLCYWLDLYAIPYPKDRSLHDVVSEEDANFMWECQVEDILRPLLEDDDVVLAFCSRATCLKFAKYVLGNGCEKRGMEKLHKLYEKNPWKFISASDRVLIVNYHGSAIYEYFMVLLEHKCEVSNAFFTNALKVITGDPNVAPCTFASDIFSQHSEIFAFMHRVMMKKIKLGGKNSAAKRDDSVLSYLLLLEDDLTPKQA